MEDGTVASAVNAATASLSLSFVARFCNIFFFARSSAFVLPISLHKQHDILTEIVKYKRKDRDSDKLQQTHNELKLWAYNLVRL